MQNQNVIRAAKPQATYICSQCGNPEVEALQWVALNSGRETGEGPNGDSVWCPLCEQHFSTVCLRHPDGYCSLHGISVGPACKPRPTKKGS